MIRPAGQQFHVAATIPSRQPTADLEPLGRHTTPAKLKLRIQNFLPLDFKFITIDLFNLLYLFVPELGVTGLS